MRRFLIIAGLSLAALFGLAAPSFATVSEPDDDPLIDPAPCVNAATDGDADNVIAVCTPLIDQEKTGKPERVKALLARAAAFDRKQQFDRALGDYDTALMLDATKPDGFNARGELRRRQGNRPGALADFAAAVKRDPQHQAARANYKSLALELERLGAQLAVKNKPSFDCKQAKRPVQKAICADPELADLDREIDAAHQAKLRHAAAGTVSRRALLRAQDAYLAERNAAFGRSTDELRAAMKARLRQLRGGKAD
ncbi:hypothetical protein [Rhodopseudomonas palustris]|uniref:Tetratricopeptide TPR_2 n=1 Tax=Rhodopseudomonas palustris (strain BisB18) TaxID=316056 RepID=Q20Y66_RHOPB